ncbi:hypothetical protein HDF10_000273 [Edaphobacter lichenicola]|uniref:Uncharacterized protein n=1 Tax=Tunturiibacter lichenicola TaxID=2051959 RepID=A0A7W8J496_9BACT|nr:hypothetical protein [Edaphobacter lichenicola]
MKSDSSNRFCSSFRWTISKIMELCVQSGRFDVFHSTGTLRLDHEPVDLHRIY